MQRGQIKAFKEFLNKKFPELGGSGKCGTKTGSTKRAYGDYLYSQDRYLFLIDMAEAIKSGEFVFQPKKQQ